MYNISIQILHETWSAQKHCYLASHASGFLLQVKPGLFWYDAYSQKNIPHTRVERVLKIASIWISI